MHIFLGRLHQTVVNDVFRRLAEQRRRRVQADGRLLREGFVPLRGVLARGVLEEPCAQGLPDAVGVAAAGDDGEAVALEDLDELFADVLGALHAAGLDEVLLAPAEVVIASLPGVVGVQ